MTTSTRATAAGSAVHPGTSVRRGRWIEHWEPENPAFWEAIGRPVARRNLVVSIIAEHLGFSVWLIWSASSALMTKAGFDFTPQQLFWLVAMPNLVGSMLRLPYTFAVPKFGGRNWTVVSALMLVVPTVLFAVFVQHPATPYWVFVLIAAVAGVGGGNFASSMANINFFYPAHRKGAALGLNAAGGNVGAAFVQFFLPIIVGGAGAFGLVQAASGGIDLPRAGYVYGGLAIIAATLAFFFMDNLRVATSSVREQLSVVREPHTWVMAFLYIGTFGSFMGYSSAMPLLIKINFWDQPIPSVEGIGINFAYYAFLGALVGSATRPLGGWLADRYGGARVTVLAFAAMIVGTLLVLLTLSTLRVVPKIDAGTDPAGFHYPAAVRSAVDHNSSVFPWYLISFLLVLAATGVANGSAYRMIPAIWRKRARLAGPEGSAARLEAEKKAPNESSAALGLVSAVGAFGGFLIPITFGAPWVADPVSAVRSAFVVFTCFYVVCMAVTWFCYLRRRATMSGSGV